MDFLKIALYLSPIFILLYIYINRKYSFWTERGVIGPRAIFPFGYLLAKFSASPVNFELSYLKKYGKVYGVYNGTTPTLSISDVSLIKQVLVKDFHLFMNRRNFKALDPYWAKNLFFLSGEDWKRVRSITTPVFTTGKLKKMFPLLKESVNKLSKYFETLAQNSNNSMDVKHVISGFTIDVIASTLFGTDTGTNENRSQFNSFLYHAQRLFTKVSSCRIVLILTLPMYLLRLFNIRHAFPYDSYDFLINILKTMTRRNGKRNDFIRHLRDIEICGEDINNMNFNQASSDCGQNNEKNLKVDDNVNTKLIKYLTDYEIVAQGVVFFIAGFETTASTITHAIFELTINPDVQERLYNEVIEKLAHCDPNDIEQYYDAICNKIPYLDAVIKETLRKYPPVPRLERRLGADDYKLGDISLKRDNLIEISTIAVHYDPDNYEDPFKYWPDRFMPENKDKLVPYSYIPFGDGPRNCVGMRFAYQEIKICLAEIIKKLRFVPNEKTPEKLEFLENSGILISNKFEITIKSRV